METTTELTAVTELEDIINLIPSKVIKMYKIEINNFLDTKRIFITTPAWITLDKGKVKRVDIYEYSVEIIIEGLIIILKRDYKDIQLILF